jgi:hypothetical protein
MDKESTLDFDFIPKQTKIQKFNSEEHDHEIKMTLGKVIFSRSLEIEVDQLNILNDISDIDVLDEDKLTGTIGIWTNDLTIEEGVVIKAPKIVLFANDTLIIK